MKSEMKQAKREAHLLDNLRVELDRAKRLRLSLHRIDCATALPANSATIYRWLKGEAQPGVDRLYAVIQAVRQFLDSEEMRLSRGANTVGGPLLLDSEFMTASRGGVTIRLKEQEFKLLEAVRSTGKRPAYLDWIGQTTGLGKSSLHRAACMLRRKLRDVDFELITLMGRGGEPPAYTLSDRAGGETGAAA